MFFFFFATFLFATFYKKSPKNFYAILRIALPVLCPLLVFPAQKRHSDAKGAAKNF